MSSDSADSDGRVIQVEFRAADIKLGLQGTELATAARTQ